MEQYWWVIVVLIILLVLELVAWLCFLLFKCSVCIDPIDTDDAVTQQPVQTNAAKGSSETGQSVTNNTAARTAVSAPITKGCISCRQPIARRAIDDTNATKKPPPPTSSSNIPKTPDAAMCSSPHEAYCGESIGCVDFESDSFHCGSCSHACTRGERCEQGQCVSAD